MQPTFDPIELFEREYQATKPALKFQAKTVAEARRWQRTARSRLDKLLGDFPSSKGIPKATVRNKVQRSECARIELDLELRPGWLARAYFLVPNNCPPRQPALLAIPGHGRGVDDIVGIAPDGSERSKREPYQYDFAVQCAQQGYPTLALEPLGFGHRRPESWCALHDAGDTFCHVPAAAALLLGRTLLGYRVQDCRRAVDWLCAQPEVDHQRLGMVGISGGGTLTLFTTCLDLRIKAALISGYFNTFHDSVYSIQHCIDNHVPGMLQSFEMPDLAGLLAPRAVCFEQGAQDQIFPLAAFEKAVRKASQIYKLFKASDHVATQTWEAGHEFNGEVGFKHLKQWL